jgi:hypothetical protein
VGVEEHDADRAVHRRERAQLAEDDEMVSAEAQRPRSGPRDRLEVRGDLADRLLGVPRSDGDVAEVCDGQPPEDLSPLRRVVRTERDRCGADRLRPEAGARPVRRRGVERDPEDGDFDAFRVLDERATCERLHP